MERKTQSGQMLILLIVMVVIVGAGFMVGGFNYTAPKYTNQPGQNDAQVQSDNTHILPDENKCTHFDGICHPLAKLSCCSQGKVTCKSQKCTGTLTANNQPASASPCIEGLDQKCQEICGDQEGFLCF